MAELKIARDTDVSFGAGCDYWMQWWIGGQEMLSTLDHGNLIYPISLGNYTFHCRLEPGKHLVVIRTVSGSGGRQQRPYGPSHP